MKTPVIRKTIYGPCLESSIKNNNLYKKLKASQKDGVCKKAGLYIVPFDGKRITARLPSSQWQDFKYTMRQHWNTWWDSYAVVLIIACIYFVAR